MEIHSMQHQNAFRTLNGGLFVAALGALTWTVSIPGSNGGALLFGLSPVRLAIAAVLLLIAGMLLWLTLRPKSLPARLARQNDQTLHPKLTKVAILCAVTLFWITLWLPAGNLLSLSDEFTRLRPLLLLVELTALTWLLFFNWTMLRQSLAMPAAKKWWLLPAVGLLASALAFWTIRWTSQAGTGGSIIESPGTPITPLQMVICVFAFGLLRLLIPANHASSRRGKTADIIVFIALWAATAVAWALTPFPCGVDRPGPYPPFGNCYPQVKDAAYSIGSHYITLGQGVFNGWPTDKPFYMLFLAVGQWLAGPEINRYLLFQIVVIALAPTCLYLLVRRMAGTATGLSAALLLVLEGVNAIRLNASLGVVNVKFENTEWLTGLLLLLAGIAFYKYFSGTQKVHWILAASGLLGAATLTRMDPAFILPLMLALLIAAYWKNRRKLLLSLAALLLGFCIVFLPWAVNARDASGNNFYWSKIQTILHVRYSAQSAEPGGLTDGGVLAASVKPKKPAGAASRLLFHFVNNEVTSLEKLPINLSLLPLQEVTDQEIWKDASASTFVAGKFSLANALVLLANLTIVLAGVFWAWKRWKAAGLVPLLMQVGYNLGNAAAQTSGGRYLEPTFWVTLLYFMLGVLAVVSAFTKAEDPAQLHLSEPAAKSPHSLGWTLALLVFLGALLPLTNLVPDRLADAGPKTALAQARAALVDGGFMTPAAFEALTSNPRAVVGEGYMVHMRFYDSPVFPGEAARLEMTILGKDNVYVSYSPRFTHFKTLKTQDRLIVIGCSYRDTTVDFWGAQELLLRTLIILRVDEQTGAVEVLKAPAGAVGCKK